MAAGNRIRRGRAVLGGIFCARLSLPWLVGIVSGPAWRHHAVVAGVDRSASAIRLVHSRRRVFDRPTARFPPQSLQFALPDGTSVRTHYFVTVDTDNTYRPTSI